MSLNQPISCTHLSSPDRICPLCGCYAFIGLHQYGVKTSRFFGTINNLSLLKLSSNQFQTNPNVKALSEQTIQRIGKVEQKMKLGLDTIALGVYLYYVVFGEGNEEEKDVGICICLSAKFLEHNSKKMVHKFRKYFKKIFQKEQYQQKQSLILSKIDFNLNIINFTHYLFNYLSKGGCFSSQMIDASKFQQSIIKSSKRVIYNGNFIKFKPEELATTILYNCRVEYKLVQIWNWHVEQCTKVSAKEAQKRNLVIKPYLMAKIS